MVRQIPPCRRAEHGSSGPREQKMCRPMKVGFGTAPDAVVEIVPGRLGTTIALPKSLHSRPFQFFGLTASTVSRTSGRVSALLSSTGGVMARRPDQFFGHTGAPPGWRLPPLGRDLDGLGTHCCARRSLMADSWYRSQSMLVSSCATMSGSCICTSSCTAPASRCGSKFLLECAGECRLRLISRLFGNPNQRITCVPQLLRRNLQAPVSEVVHRRHADHAREPFGEA